MLKNEQIEWNNDKIIPCYELHEIAFKRNIPGSSPGCIKRFMMYML